MYLYFFQFSVTVAATYFFKLIFKKIYFYLDIHVWFCVLNTGLTWCSWWSVRDYKWSLYPPGSLTTVWLKCWTQSNFLISFSCGQQQLLSSIFCWCLRFTRKIKFCPAILEKIHEHGMNFIFIFFVSMYVMAEIRE